MSLNVPGEDVLIRKPARPARFGYAYRNDNACREALEHTFISTSLRSQSRQRTLPTITTEIKLALATDWDTEQSLALAPERTAGMIYSLGFRGRVNHYVGALWFYELTYVG